MVDEFVFLKIWLSPVFEALMRIDALIRFRSATVLKMFLVPRADARVIYGHRPGSSDT